MLREGLSKCPKFLQAAGGEGVKSTSLQAFSNAMRNVTSDVADALVKCTPKIEILVAEVKVGECLYVPPGWWVSMATVNCTAVGGLRKSALVKSAVAPLTPIKECADGDSAASTVACVDMLLNVLSHAK